MRWPPRTPRSARLKPDSPATGGSLSEFRVPTRPGDTPVRGYQLSRLA
jgi:hypothetical protein